MQLFHEDLWRTLRSYDLKPYGDIFKHFDNIVSALAGFIKSGPLDKFSNNLMFVGVGLNIFISFYHNIIADNGKTKERRWTDFGVDVVYELHSTALTWGLGAWNPWLGIFAGYAADFLWESPILNDGRTPEQYVKDNPSIAALACLGPVTMGLVLGVKFLINLFKRK